MAVRYISPSGSGNRDGTSWSNAGTLANLDGFIGEAGPGGEVLLRSDAGSYSIGGTSFVIGHGGAAGAPVTIRGVDASGAAMNAEFVGSRADPWLPGLDSGGQEVFQLRSGADHLVFESLAFKNVGNGAFRIGADIADLMLQHIAAGNVQRFMLTDALTRGATASIDGLTVRDVDVHGFSRAVLELGYDSRSILVEDVVGDSEGQDGDNFAMGVHLSGTIHDVVLRHTTMLNSHDSVNSYWNGDGFATERGVYNVLFEDTYAAGNTDGGYDLKSSNTLLLRAVAEDNKRNFRFWSDGITMQDSTSRDPHISGGSGTQAHIWVARGAEARVVHSLLTDSDPDTVVLDVSDGSGASLVLVDTTIERAAGSIFTRFAVGSSVSIDGAYYGTDSNGVVTGSGERDSLVGMASSDELHGAGGDDLLNGRAGADTMVGGDGSDWAAYNNSPAGVKVDLVSGFANGGHAEGDRLFGIENLIGSPEDDTLVGDAGANFLWGGEGADTIEGGAGTDTLIGGLGVDTVSYVSSPAGVVANLAAGIASGGDAARDLLSEFENLTGSEHADVLIGSAVANVIMGRNGNDVLYGLEGNDVLVGGQGGDLTGGDTIYGGDGGDAIDGSAGRDHILGGKGQDSVFGGGGDDELIGGWQNDRLSGDAGADLVLGDSESFSSYASRGANDWMGGGDGADLLFGDARVISNGARGGNDTIDGGDGDDVAYGDAESLVGGGGKDRVYGGAGNDWLYGDSLNFAGAIGGSDTLDGGAGDDHLFGGGGDDLFVFEHQANGLDCLMDFVAGGTEDAVKLIGSNLKDFAAVRAALTTDPATGDAVLPYDGGEIDFAGIGVSLLTIADFQFG